MRRTADILLRALASRKFFVCIVALLVFQAVWIALSFSYPMLWDEYYHFGLIQYYGHHINPIITTQPHSLDLYGEVSRLPKYFYHYLMSFPYRLISLFTANQAAQIIMLRLINIGMFAGALVAYRQAMLRITKSKALVHLVLFIVVLFPLSSLLAAQINYDNLQLLLTGLVLYWTLRFIQAKKFEIEWLLLVVGVGLISCVVKYTFLPVLAAILAFMVYWIGRKYRRDTFGSAVRSFKAIGRWSKVGLVLLVLVGIGLSAERFGGNLIGYHQIDPACPKVLSVERCMSFSPYNLEYTLAQQKKAAHTPLQFGPAEFTTHSWLPQLYQQYFSSGTQLGPGWFVVQNPLRIPFITLRVAGAIGLVCFLLYSPKLLRRPEVQLSVVCIIALAAALWLVDYGKYKTTGIPLAIQGRYLLPIVPLGILLGGMAVSHILPWRRLKVVLAGLTLLGLIWGGGLITHIVLSQPDWYWHNQMVIDVNNSVRNALRPIVF